MMSTSIMMQYSSLLIPILSSSVHLAHIPSNSVHSVQLILSSVQPTPLTSDNLIYTVIYIVVSVVVLLIVILLTLIFIIVCLRRRKKRQIRYCFSDF